MTTDTTALQERIEHALWGVAQVYDARDGRGTEAGVHAPVYEVVAAVLPIIAAEVQAAKAEAWNECVRAAYAPEGRITHGPNPYEAGCQPTGRSQL